MNTKNEPHVNIDEFMEVFPIVVNDILNGISIDTPELKTHIEDLLQYAVPNGKKFRGLLVPETFFVVAKKEDLTPENIRLAYIGGWIIEMAQAVALLMDDIVDNSPTRRGQPCWYKKEDIGLKAIKDGFFLQEALYFLLGKHYSDKTTKNISAYFRKFVSEDTKHVLGYKITHHALWQCIGGQTYDCMTKKDGKLVLDFFTMANYKTLVKYKTGYSFYAPVLFAFHLAKITSEVHQQVQSVIFGITEMFQIQDDFLDCFGDEETNGEDIREGKCTWLAVKALELANSEQRELFEKHYGSDDQESVDIIYKLYQDLNLPKLYEIWEEEAYKKIQSEIQALPEEMPTPIFSKILRKFYKRNF